MRFRYQQLMLELQQQIGQGQYSCGAKLPGVRQLAKRRSVSVATVLACYRQLEQDGYIQARARSGYFVKARSLPPPIVADKLQCIPMPAQVSGQTMALALSKAAADPSFVRLGAAVPAADFLPQRALQQAMQQVIKQQPRRLLRYETSRGSPELRQEIATRMALHGAIVSPDDVLITNGCQEALMLSLKAVTKPGDIVAIESPAFYGLLQALEAVGVQALPLPTDPVTGLQPEVLQQALQQWPVTACVLIANFSNPQGSLIPVAQKKQIISLLTEHKVTLIEDDTYGDLPFNGMRPPSFMALAPDADIFYCSTFSKTLSPDLRLGWVIAPRHSAALEYQKFISNISTAALPQLAVSQLLQSGRYERYLRQIRPQYQQAVQHVSSCIGQLFPVGTRISQPQGGFVLWLELPVAIDGYRLAQQAMAAKISIAPGAIFSPAAHAATAGFNHFIRLNCAVTQDHALQRALQTLAQLCLQQLKR